MADARTIIDPPVGPYDTPEKIEDWIAELHEMEPSPDVDDAIREAEEWLKYARERDSQGAR
ncbi:MAG TPA: hypothetical protein ENK05_11830 [Gammaproteobacteria bacterium]|nr:hypothetical protein [Gammaproteobacteria bacterium]